MQTKCGLRVSSIVAPGLSLLGEPEIFDRAVKKFEKLIHDRESRVRHASIILQRDDRELPAD